MITTDQQHIIIDVLAKYDPQLVGIFGSYARSEHREDSDLDILIDLKKKISLLELVELEEELSEKLGIKVDLVTKNSVSPLIRDYVYKDLKLIA